MRKRLELAAELVSEGKVMKVSQLKFASVGDDRLQVCGDTRCYDLNRMTKRRALVELQQVKDFFVDVLEICPDFMKRCGKSKVRYALAYDYRIGAIGICEESDGELRWLIDIED